jgi:hypothetical protein
VLASFFRSATLWFYKKHSLDVTSVLRFDIYDGRLTELTNFMFLTAFKFFKGVAAKSYCT